MSRISLIRLGLLAVLTVTVIVPASASAHEFLVEGKGIAKGEKVEDEGIVGVHWIETSILKLPIGEECSEGTGTGNLEEGGKSKSRGEAKGCQIFEINKGKKVYLTSCEIKEPIVVESTGLLTGIGEDLETGAGAEETFSEFEIKTCTLKGKYKIKGQEICVSPLAEVEKVIHEGVCTSVGGKLKLGAEPVRLYGLDAGLGKLKSGKPSSSN